MLARMVTLGLYCTALHCTKGSLQTQRLPTSKRRAGNAWSIKDAERRKKIARNAPSRLHDLANATDSMACSAQSHERKSAFLRSVLIFLMFLQIKEMKSKRKVDENGSKKKDNATLNYCSQL